MKKAKNAAQNHGNETMALLKSEAFLENFLNHQNIQLTNQSRLDWELRWFSGCRLSTEQKSLFHHYGIISALLD